MWEFLYGHKSLAAVCLMWSLYLCWPKSHSPEKLLVGPREFSKRWKWNSSVYFNTYIKPLIHTVSIDSRLWWWNGALKPLLYACFNKLFYREWIGLDWRKKTNQYKIINQAVNHVDVKTEATPPCAWCHTLHSNPTGGKCTRNWLIS